MKTVRNLSVMNGGERGIRTPDTVSHIHAFQACSFNHSDISPNQQKDGVNIAILHGSFKYFLHKIK